MQLVKQNIQNDEKSIHELRSYLKGSKVIEELHMKQLEMHTYLIEALQLLSQDLNEMDFVLILGLLRGQKECQYISQLSSCVHLASFEKEKSTIHATFVHQKPIIKSYKLFSCEVLYYEGEFYINNFHNRVLDNKNVDKFNVIRKTICLRT